MKKNTKSILALTCLVGLPLSAMAAKNYNVIVSSKYSSYYMEEWEVVFKYSEWSDVGTPYDCSDDYEAEDLTYFKTTICSQDQTRTYNQYEVAKYSGEERLIEETGGSESKTIETSNTVEVASAIIDSASGSFNVSEGDSGITEFEVKVTLNKAFDEDLSFSYNTQDETTSSVLDKASNLVYDEFGNPFVSVVDNANGGKLIFDGGFPKYYNANWNNATEFNGMPMQFKFMHNIVKWISEEHSSRGKVLIYGDAADGASYSLSKSVSSGFGTSISETVKLAGYTPVIKSAQHSDFNGSKETDRKVNMTLEEMNKYSSIIVMSTGGWESLSVTASNNFTTYVNNGGGVFIVTDHDYFQKTGNQVLRKFGSEFYGVINRTGSHSAYKMSTIWSGLSGTEYDSSHQLWSGMSASDSLPAGGSEGNVRLFTPQTDIEAVSGSLVFTAGETEKTVILKINGDRVKESNEQFRFMIQGDENSFVPNAEGSKLITIIDDD